MDFVWTRKISESGEGQVLHHDVYKQPEGAEMWVPKSVLNVRQSAVKRRAQVVFGRLQSHLWSEFSVSNKLED